MKVRTPLAGILGIVVATGTMMAARQANRFEFAVASIKPNAAGDHRSTMQMTPGRLTISGATLRELIRTAYRIDDFQLVGGPAWISSDRWDVEGKTDENVSQSQISEMLQNLLVAQFHLKFHADRRNVPMYELVIARKGPNLQEAKPESAASSHSSGNRQDHGSGSHAGQASMTMAQLVEMLGQIVGRTVIDKTGLKGSYDIRLTWRPDPGQGPAVSDHGGPGREGTAGSPSADSSLPSIFTALQEQLGLKLESAKGPAQAMVIDSAQKPLEQR